MEIGHLRNHQVPIIKSENVPNSDKKKPENFQVLHFFITRGIFREH